MRTLLDKGRNGMIGRFLVIVGCLSFLLVAGLGAAAQGKPASGQGTLAGQVFVEKDQAMTEGVVSFFNVDSGPAPDQGSVRRIPDKVVRVESNGRFTVDLTPGSYYIGALLRSKDAGPGPPRPGEKFLFVRDSGGKLQSFVVKVGEKVEAGALSGVMPTAFPELEHYFTVQGMVTDENGKPFANAVVLVKRDIKTPKPVYVSEKTGADGLFRLRLPPGASYYLVAKETLSVGRPAAGSYLGTFGGETPVALSGKENEVLSGKDIKMEKIPDPDALRQERQIQNRAPETSPGAPPDMSPAPPRP